VSIVNFVTSGDYTPAGSSGILNAKGTLMIAHPDVSFKQTLTDNTWRDIFNTLKVDN
jgi:hypothetical protein